MAAQSELKPMILERKFVPKVWGGRRLGTVLQVALPPGEKIGETWELYDRPDGSSLIQGTDQTLRDLMERDPRNLLGSGISPTRQGYFPLLLKFIDATEALSVQVHPDPVVAGESSDGGKHEGWIVLVSSAQGRIIVGTKPGVSQEQFAEVAHTDAVENLLHAFRPQAGQAIYVPAGTVHAIGPELVLFEIQQNSDVTYRLYDWGRERETHVARGLAAVAQARRSRDTTIPAGVQKPEQIPGGGEWLLKTRHFRVRRFKTSIPATLGTEGAFKVLTTLRGGGMLGWRSGGAHPPLHLRTGDTLLVPACTETVFLSPTGDWEFFWSDAGS